MTAYTECICLNCFKSFICKNAKCFIAYKYFQVQLLFMKIHSKGKLPSVMKNNKRLESSLLGYGTI